MGGRSVTHPPSVDALARDLATRHELPHAVLVDCARRAVSEQPIDAVALADRLADELRRALLADVVNATGVLLHTNLGRAPLSMSTSGRPSALEFDLATGSRGSRQDPIARLLRILTGAESAVVVNNNAAAVMLVLAALANGRGVALSRGESVEIGGGFRVPEVMEQSGARLVDVGTTNRTRLADYSRAIDSPTSDIALVMKVHPSNFAQIGFVESTPVPDLATLPVPVVVDIGSGLLDNDCPWMTARPHGGNMHVPGWLRTEPAARQALADGADLVTFSGDKLLGGPQCGIVAGRADLVAACAAHPLMRALRPGGHTLQLLQEALLHFAARTACEAIPFWRMLTTDTETLARRAEEITRRAGCGRAIATTSLVGAGSAPDTTIDSHGIALDGDRTAALRGHVVPVVARQSEGTTILDLRSVDPADDGIVVDALRSLGAP
ncbi:MAG: L-seryl-tRNA(Sec) selenium transferase [Actinobacteria bacterium]|nr:L-seryl-tRNA(Sec) selenium transferase [Actinomycetota bacterium]